MFCSRHTLHYPAKAYKDHYRYRVFSNKMEIRKSVLDSTHWIFRFLYAWKHVSNYPNKFLMQRKRDSELIFACMHIFHGNSTTASHTTDKWLHLKTTSLLILYSYNMYRLTDTPEKFVFCKFHCIRQPISIFV